MATSDGSSGVGDGARCSGEDRGNRVRRKFFGKRRNVDSDHHSTTHREHVAARVCSRDRAEVVGVVDERREEVDGADQCQIVGQ